MISKKRKKAHAATWAFNLNQKDFLKGNEFIKIDKQKMAERLKEDVCRLVGKQEFDVAYARWLDLQIVLKDLGNKNER